MATLHITVGIPGSGKSTIAAALGVEVVSPDAIRVELCGTVADQTRNDLVFTEAHRQVAAHLAAGRDVAFDATNVEVRARAALAEIADAHAATRIAWRMDTPHSVSRARNAARVDDSRVPEAAMAGLEARFDATCGIEQLTREGWAVRATRNAGTAP